MYTNHMTTSELARLYYSAGIPTIAAIYEQLADAELTILEYEEQHAEELTAAIAERDEARKALALRQGAFPERFKAAYSLALKARQLTEVGGSPIETLGELLDALQVPT
ncbi:MAG: hypothetical protein ACYDBH_00635 [Acidobacteriaceae bacterium]